VHPRRLGLGSGSRLSISPYQPNLRTKPVNGLKLAGVRSDYTTALDDARHTAPPGAHWQEDGRFTQLPQAEIMARSGLGLTTSQSVDGS